ncbi:MAG: glutathione S-transferase N-terminal domain-containing protein [Pseudomonadota bacterium]
MYTLYGMTGSGNCYKPALAMSQLGIAFRWQEVEMLKGATRAPEYLALNPNGKVPL